MYPGVYHVKLAFHKGRYYEVGYPQYDRVPLSIIEDRLEEREAN